MPRRLLPGYSFLALLLWSILPGCTPDGTASVPGNPLATSEAAPSIPEVISFNYHVRPILSDRCYACHGPDRAKIEAGLSLSHAAGATLPLGEQQDHFAIVPGDVAASTLVDRIYATDPTIVMPPPESNLRLEEYEKAILKKWIEQGAAYEDHWSFQPLTDPALPAVAATDFVRNGIDHFILSKIEAAGLSPSPEAEKELLIRRLAFDLTGLPPSPEEIDRFLGDTGPDAYAQLVDRYLSGPAYAENMAAQWMDVARYADTHGYQDDLERVMWPWRDWVIHAFRENMPYDQFVGYQLAGDLLPDATLEQKIATGFNRNHKITQEGGVIPEEYRVEYVADRTQTFGKAFLGLSVECAKCHDHKYDPISQEDFYSLFAFFNNVPEKGLIETYGATPEPFITLTAREIEERLHFINNLDSVPRIELMVMEEQPTPRTTFVLGRGAYDNPQRAVRPNVPASVLPFGDRPANRRGLSDWLFDPDNPLTARVMVNRLWMMCFGRGIVSTPDDFGAQGALPTHPELLDHLASRFVESGWDMKAMLRYIVSSATYRQSSRTTAAQRARDPENILYARGERRRLSAEKIRDHFLASSGLLVRQVGGPSVKPYQPEGLWREVIGGGGGSTARYEMDRGDKQYRRSLYTFWKRTVPPPDMITFDANTRDFCMVNRETTSTPLQALVMMNSPQVIEAARNLAYQSIERHASVTDRITFMYLAATSRHPDPATLDRLQEYYQTELAALATDEAEAVGLLETGDAPQRDLLPAPEMAAHTLVAMAIYNLDESISRS
ncbi:PSD1 and planctomycete cytochrome C domain-containing protein [Lewinella sp. W8]|uniref:PSD1 and planctomycete cytochrome C domain-containing protein n=1 Tax=Lewinella sp. W8 TaxID=2528208 RepID=UPI0010688902|nr:PSD1 and planctomycete cytochrome C domain-containing protein [Lewinella sp. W8]MTB51702.1 DUF1553 domain-containing protein [Lewinella sp. W8]